MDRQSWCRCPTDWIIDSDKLTGFKWGKEGGSAHTSALMCLTAIVHNADQKTGIARVNYDQFGSMTGRSRTSISNGLSVLREFELIESADTQSEYALPTFNPEKGWGKFPLQALYRRDSIDCFHGFSLRNRTELDALKFLYLFIAFRDNSSNLASIGYNKISQRTGVDRRHIRSALSFLSINRLVYVEKVARDDDESYSTNTYRICGIDPYIHGGTRGREDIAA